MIVNDDINLTLPWPPSVNRYYRHVGPKVLISKDGRQYRTAVEREVRRTGSDVKSEARLELLIIASPPDRRRRDLDNILKALLDASEKTGVYQDDSQIDDLAVSRGDVVPGGEVRVMVRELTP